MSTTTTTNNKSSKTKEGVVTLSQQQDRNSAGDNNDTSRTRLLLQEADDLLAQSYLIFLYSDLRLLSATGRVRVKLECLMIDSDNVVKNKANQVAVLESEISHIRALSQNNGISPAQIMAALLVELRREVLQARRQQQDGSDEQEENTTSNNNNTYSILPTITNKKNRKMVEEDMDSLLKAYNYMIGMDLKKELPTVSRSGVYGTTTTTSPRRARVSMFVANKMQDRLQQMRAAGAAAAAGVGAGTGAGTGAAAGAEKDNTTTRNAASPPDDAENIHTTTSNSGAQGSERDTTNSARAAAISTTSSSRSAAPPSSPLPKRGLLRGSSQRRLPVSEADYLEETNVGEVGDAFFTTPTYDSQLGRNLSEQEILDLMENAVKTRDYGKLDFMRDFFREDSVSAVMIQSDTKIVWMNDWYPLKDLTYAVAVNKEKKEVLLVFRGAITKADWAHATNWDIKKVDNPIQEDYQDKSAHVDVHAGFYRYLFRIRKDTGTRKFDEIKTVVHEYGSKLIGQDYRLIVTGHSLGAALSTVFGLFASTDERFTSRGPIKMYTFGSPYVGAKNFLMAFRHQEISRKIQYLRMHNERDGVAHMPIGWRGRFQHVGVSIAIHRLPAGCWKWRGQKPPTVYYGHETSDWALYWKAFRENWFFNMPLPWNTAKAHTLHELRRRLLPALGLLKEDRLSITLDKLYEELVYNAGDKKEEDV